MATFQLKIFVSGVSPHWMDLSPHCCASRGDDKPDKFLQGVKREQSATQLYIFATHQ
jgi:hypothetical protein